ncbi:dihydropteroate synthase [Streptomyces sp. NPDC047002]|uniref:dihydropteroate synthase n=1 Tax=Streptomyces sp. NPDC047002 TaxID=3155475 RepID=UPI003456626A
MSESAFTARPRADRMRVLGILNVTPDSFSDGGRWDGPGAAAARGARLRAEGADLVDVGGESTRPGAGRVPADEELARVVPVVGLLAASGIRTSVDTTRARVAEAALRAGAVAVNDVSGGRADPAMSRVVRDAGCPWILMHSRGTSATMRRLAVYHDVVGQVVDELSRRVDAALAAGVPADALVLDPGLGFAKTPEHDWLLLAHLDRLCALGFPVLVGASRKSFLGALLAGRDGRPRPVAQREDATTAVTAYAALAGAWGVRVHAVRAAVDAARAVAAIRAAGPPDAPRPADGCPPAGTLTARSSPVRPN